jgi:hypothetical protein
LIGGHAPEQAFWSLAGAALVAADPIYVSPQASYGAGKAWLTLCETSP